MKKYHLRVYDNFHYGDESAGYDYGQFETYELALIAAQKEVESSLRHEYKAGMTEDELLMAYAFYGEEPIIVPEDFIDGKYFSAGDYAHEIVGKICKDFRNRKLQKHKK